MSIRRHATASGTESYFQRRSVRTDFVKKTAEGMNLSSIGIGMYKGEESPAGDHLWRESLRYGLQNGINVVDTALKYRNMRSEKVLGEILAECFQGGGLAREEVFVSSKGGLFPFSSGSDPCSEAGQKIAEQLGVPRSMIWNCRHCIHPIYLEWALEKSLENLNIETIDCYFLHNPEHAALLENPPSYHQVFEMLERARGDGKIGAYGIASWNGFRRRPGSRIYLSLVNLLDAARDVGGENHGLRWLEVPLSLGMPFAAVEKTVAVGQDHVTLFQAAKTFNLNMLTSASLYEGKIPELMTLQRLMRTAGREDSSEEEHAAKASIPHSENSIAQLFDVLVALREREVDLSQLLSVSPLAESNPFVGALDVVRSIPDVRCALAGMEKPEYVRSNLQLASSPCIRPKDLGNVWDQLKPRRTADNRRDN